VYSRTTPAALRVDLIFFQVTVELNTDLEELSKNIISAVCFHLDLTENDDESRSSEYLLENSKTGEMFLFGSRNIHFCQV
jgi:hypothetical protein